MRKTKIFVVTDEGRDKGKRFVIKEMPAFQAENWAMRAFLALARSGVDISESLRSSGMAGLAGLAVSGLRALQGMDYGEAKPLLDEMLDCVHHMPDPKTPEFTRPLILSTPDGEGDDVQEVLTFMRLRKEVIDLHTSFFTDGMSRNSTSETTTSQSLHGTPISPAQSAA